MNLNDIPAPKRLRRVLLVGAGGTGGFLAPAITTLLSGERASILVVDADLVEKKNLNRQLFGPKDIGRYKADVLAERLRSIASQQPGKPGTASLPQYLELDGAGAEGFLDAPEDCLAVCCADNHRARLATLAAADRAGCMALVCGNEYWDAEAYIYHPGWLGTRLDPREYFPELLTSRAGDPTMPACTGEAADASPQLVSANHAAASYGLHLAAHWFLRREASEVTGNEPIHHLSSAYRIFSKRIRDYYPPEK